MNPLPIVVAAGASVCAAVLALPVIVDLAALARRRTRTLTLAHPPRSHFVFLIPAHNEEGLITSCVASVAGMAYPRRLVRIVVIADNCSDGTAAAARAAGAECLERSDTVHPGKPHAVAWALQHLADGAHDAVVILDADAVVDPEYASALDSAGPLRNKAIECYDDVRNPGDSSLTRMAAVLSAGRFRGSFALKHRAGLNVPLSDGMCLGVDLLKAHPWRAFGLSEDWELYAQLTAAGARIELAPDAHLYAQETGTLRQSASQRRRWLTGKLDALRRVGPELIRSNRIGWLQKLDTLAELAVPGPAVHLGVAVVLGAVVAGSAAPGAAAIIAALVLSLTRPAVYAVIGVVCVPDRLRSIASFTYLPIYAGWRLVIAATSVLPLRPRLWVRTARE
ncbi:MAG TPA: glycosyltransferase family 2 protein [Gemmatimonadaceae bacterium]